MTSNGEGRTNYPYMVCWPARQLPWVEDEDGDLAPDPEQDHDMWYGPFPNLEEAKAFASRLKKTKDHWGYEVGPMYPPDHEFATSALRKERKR